MTQSSSDTLNALIATLKDRKDGDPKKSYVAQLYKKGARKIAKKLGEEATELVIESIRLEDKPTGNKRRTAFMEEAADLLFHYLVLLENHDIDFEDVTTILAGRMGVSGLEEKASRTRNDESADEGLDKGNAENDDDDIY